jgi:hypothetical protein
MPQFQTRLVLPSGVTQVVTVEAKSVLNAKEMLQLQYGAKAVVFAIVQLPDESEGRTHELNASRASGVPRTLLWSLVALAALFLFKR